MCTTRTAPVQPVSASVKKPAWVAVVLALIFAPVAAPASAFIDPLDEKSEMVTSVNHKPMRDIVLVGKRLVAVGDNGLIIYSDDSGAEWTQAEVPLSTDLNAVFFSDEKKGWAVGHGAVILHSSDGGASWSRQLDGRTLEATFVDYFKHRSGLEPERAESYLSAILNMVRPGPGQFFMGVWFDNAGTNGFAVGPFGLILASQDGGVTWQPWNIHIENNDLLHLTAIREVSGSLYITGERGRVWQFDRAHGRFVVGETGYEGTLFGLTGAGDMLLAFGLRGHVFRSTDAGRSWSPVSNELQAGVTGGAAIDDHGVVLVSQAAQVAFSSNKGASFELLNVPQPSLYTGVVALSAEQLAMVGLNGVTTLNIK